MKDIFTHTIFCQPCLAWNYCHSRRCVITTITILADSSCPAIYSRDSQTAENERQTMPSRGRARAVTKFKIFTYFQATAHPSAPVITRCNQRTPALSAPEASRFSPPAISRRCLWPSRARPPITGLTAAI